MGCGASSNKSKTPSTNVAVNNSATAIGMNLGDAHRSGDPQNLVVKEELNGKPPETTGSMLGCSYESNDYSYARSFFLFLSSLWTKRFEAAGAEDASKTDTAGEPKSLLKAPRPPAEQTNPVSGGT